MMRSAAAVAVFLASLQELEDGRGGGSTYCGFDGIEFGLQVDDTLELQLHLTPLPPNLDLLFLSAAAIAVACGFLSDWEIRGLPSEVGVDGIEFGLQVDDTPGL